MLVRKIIDKNLPRIFEGIRYLSPYDTKLFNPRLSKKYGEGKKSYQGHFHCGETMFMVKQILDKHKIPNKVFKSNHFQYMYEEYVSDHCFIIVEDNIVDLSYRQFVIDPYYSVNLKKDIYYKKIFLQYSPLFIGNITILYDFLECLNYEYMDEYGKNLFTSSQVLKFWELDQDITDKYTLSYFKENHRDLDNYTEILKLIE